MKPFSTLRHEYPDFDDLCDARDAVLRAIEMHQLSADALEERLHQYDHKIEMRFH